MDLSKAVGIGTSPRLAVALEIVACIIAAVGLTEVADLVAIHLIDWIAVR